MHDLNEKSHLYYHMAWDYTIKTDSIKKVDPNHLKLYLEDKRQADKIYLQFLAYQRILTKTYECSEKPINEIHYYYDRYTSRQFEWLEQLKKHLQNNEIHYLISSVKSMEFFEVQNEQILPLSFYYHEFKERLDLRGAQIMQEIDSAKSDQEIKLFMISLIEEIDILVEKELMKNTLMSDTDSISIKERILKI